MCFKHAVFCCEYYFFFFALLHSFSVKVSGNEEENNFIVLLEHFTAFNRPGGAGAGLQRFFLLHN